jgi:hypothetical protein
MFLLAGVSKLAGASAMVASFTPTRLALMC